MSAKMPPISACANRQAVGLSVSTLNPGRVTYRSGMRRARPWPYAYDSAVTAARTDDSELEQQRAEVEAAFREGWVPLGAGEPRVLGERVYAEARKVLDHGGWTGLDHGTIQAVRDGALPGDSLPPLGPEPLIRDVTDTEVIIHGDGPARRVAVLFSYVPFPDFRFGHRFRLESPAENREPIWLMEEIETGALDRMMQDPPAADDAGVIWTTWGD